MQSISIHTLLYSKITLIIHSNMSVTIPYGLVAMDISDND